MKGWGLMRAKKNAPYDEMKAGDFGLIECNDPSIIFSTEPKLDLSQEELHDRMEAFANEMVMDASTGFRLITAFKETQVPYALKRLYVKHRVFGFEDRLYIALAYFISIATIETD